MATCSLESLVFQSPVIIKCLCGRVKHKETTQTFCLNTKAYLDGLISLQILAKVDLSVRFTAFMELSGWMIR